MKGGNSAWQNAQAVYGAAGQQQAVVLPNGGTSNVIAMNPQAGGAPLLALQPAMVGTGSAITGGNGSGGSVLAEIAVPATLLVANELYKRRGKSSKKLFKFNPRRSRRRSNRRRR
jgi:hypothetical protein